MANDFFEDESIMVKKGELTLMNSLLDKLVKENTRLKSENEELKFLKNIKSYDLTPDLERLQNLIGAF